ncbi:autotransporter outer membrane beta-barrel domain-containing protein, partial [Synergistaceae bacterium OttesenSCG-928-D05]|nr:autotransporter outer membrane beta-barrel domain-containing protein [Synergistaceae bacterium OttesenSCG-928-D05]
MICTRNKKTLLVLTFAMFFSFAAVGGAMAETTVTSIDVTTNKTGVSVSTLTTPLLVTPGGVHIHGGAVTAGRGVNLNANTSADIAGGIKISDGASFSYGVHSGTKVKDSIANTHAIVTDGIEIASAGKGNYGIFINGNGTNTIAVDGGIKIVSSDGAGKLENFNLGIYATSADAISVGGGILLDDVTYAKGIEATSVNSIDISGGIKVSDSSLFTVGATLKLVKNVTIDGDITLDNTDDVDGINVSYNRATFPEDPNARTYLTLTGDAVINGGQGSTALVLQACTIDMTGDIHLVDGEKNLGVSLLNGGDNSNSHMNLEGDIVLSGGKENTGIEIDGTLYCARVDLGGILKVLNGDNNLGLWAGSANIYLDGLEVSGGQNNTGIRLEELDSLYLDGNVEVSGGENNIGVLLTGAHYRARDFENYAEINGDIIVSGGKNNAGLVVFGATRMDDDEKFEALVSGDISVDGEGAVGVLVSHDQSYLYLSNGSITVEDDAKAGIFVTQGAHVLLEAMTPGARSDTTLILTDSSGDVQATGSNLAGNIVHTGAKDGILSVLLSGDSSLTGAVNVLDINNQNVGGLALNPNAKIDLTLENSTWNVMDNSHTNGFLSMGANSAVDFSGSAMGTTARVNSLTGAKERFVMKTDIANETADRLIVEGTSAGNHSISVANQGGAQVTGKERVILVETADKEAGFTLANSAVDLGAFTYYLGKNSDGKGEFDAAGGQYWELFAHGGGSTPDDSSNTGSDAVNTFIGSYYLAYADTDTLMKRVGDLRNNTYQHGAWFRAYGGKFESDSRQYVKDFEQDYWAVQVGYDNKLDRDRSWFKKGDTYVGAYIGIGNSD